MLIDRLEKVSHSLIHVEIVVEIMHHRIVDFLDMGIDVCFDHGVVIILNSGRESCPPGGLRGWAVVLPRTPELEMLNSGEDAAGITCASV